jgi:RNA polymerase sigma factor (sigma-70 family)
MAVRRHVGAKKRSVEREVSRWARPRTGAFAAVQPSPSEDAMTAERVDLAMRAMAALREDDRTVLRLAVHEQLTLREVAERMDRSHEAVKKLYGRALARFTKAYRGDGDGSP